MKKMILSLCLIGMALTAGAQEKFRLGVTAGMNVSSPTNQDTKVGYNAGLLGEWDLKGSEGNSPFLSFGLLLTDKSWKREGWSYSYDDEAHTFGPFYKSTLKANPTYLQVPLHFGYRWAVSRNATLFASAGAYLAVGMFGKQKFKSKEDGNTTTLKDDVFDDNNDYRRFDWGISYRVGVELRKHYQLSVSQEWGLHNQRDSQYSAKLMNRNCSLNFGYVF